MTTEAIRARGPAVGYVVFGVVALAYLVAILQRSSLGVAAVEATGRFEVQATLLSMLGVVQMIVYAALQIPVGAMIDRWGPRLPLVLGAVLMAIGQTIVALSPEIAGAIAGRALVGAGDAMTFTAGIRALAMWFQGRRLPFLTQVFAQIGQVGQILSTFPFMLLLHATSWTIAFLSAASLSVLVLAALLVTMTMTRNPPVPHAAQRLGARETVHHVLEALRRPGTQLGFWSHFVSQSPLTLFVLMWGIPFLTVGVGLQPTVATSLLAITVFVGMVCGPLIGIVSARFPLRRSDVLLTIVTAIGIVWAAVLLWPGTPPLWLLVVLMICLAIGGPGSMIGFDYARTYNPARQHGSATGVVNVGGFLASFTMMLLVGIVLDLVSGHREGTGVESLYSLDAFRLAFLVQFPVVGLGVVMLVRIRRRMRRTLHEEEGVLVAPMWISLARWLRRAS